MASLWRPDAAPLCGYERGSLASQDAPAPGTTGRRSGSVYSLNGNFGSRLRPVPETPSTPQQPCRGRTHCTRLGTSLLRSFRTDMAGSAGHAAPWPPQAVPSAGAAAKLLGQVTGPC